MNSKISQSALILVLSLVLVPTCYGQSARPRNSDIENIGKRDINKGQSNFTSLEKEAQLGREAAAQWEKGATLVTDATINDYINRIAQNIAKNSDSKFPITIKVVQSESVNATALPGGYIYVTIGAIQSSDSEAELAWFIAQMVGHVAARHATENDTKGTMMQTGTVPTIIQTGGIGAIAAQEAAKTGLPITKAHFERTSVLEADLLGIEYLYKAGYDPQAAITNLKKLQASEAAKPKQSDIFSTMPPATDRMKATERNIKDVLPPRANNILNSPEFDTIKALAAKLSKP